MTGASNTSRKDKSRSARGFLYALIGVNLAIVAVASVVLFWHDRVENADWRLVTEFHMGASGQTRRALTEIKLLRQSLTAFERITAPSGAGPATPGEIEILRLETSERLNTIRLASQKIEALQTRFAEPRFAEATAWAADGVTRLAGLAGDETWNENLASGELAAAAQNLEARFEQLARLHLAAHDELAVADRMDRPSGLRYLLVLLVALIAGGGVAGTIILRRFESAMLAHGDTVTALHDSDAQFKAIFEQAAVGIALMTPDGRYIRTNGKMCEIMGRTAGELTGRPFRDISHPGDMESNLALLGKIQSGELSTFSMEKRYVRGDGETFWANLSVSMIRGASGEPRRMIAVVQDIDARKRAEEGAQRFNALFDQVSIGMILRDSNGILVSANGSFCEMLGYERDELIGGKLSDITHPDDRDIGKEEHLRIARGEIDSFAMEKRYLRKDGQVVWIGAMISTVRDESGSARNTTAIVADITERKRAQEALHESELLFRAIFDQAAVGIALVAMDGRYTRVNQKLCDILGYTNEELVGKNFTDVTHPDSMAQSLELVKAMEVGGDDDQIWEKQYLRKDGSPVWAERALSLIRDEAGAPRYFIVVIQDIEARKQAEEALGRLNAELEDRVEERTAELRAAQQELVRSERLATLGQLTATVSHELRNPLGAMRTSVYIVEQVADMSDSRLARSIDRINRSIVRCDNIIDELLDFTRIRNLEPTDTRIDSWLNTVLDEQPAVPGIVVRRKLGTADAVVPVDANRLRRAIINVYENACQASAGPDGSRPANRKHRVTVETRLRKNRLEIVIADNGQGIPADIRPKIFEPLFSTKNFGVGLGLPTVRQIMEQHGGGVDVVSKPGKGTRFVLWVPLAPVLETVK